MAAVLKFLRTCKWLHCSSRAYVRGFSSSQVNQKDQMADIRQITSDLRGFVTGHRSSLWSGEKDRASVQSVVGNQELPVDQNQLLAREMSASYQEVFIPLGSDTLLREQYLNFFQMVRIGRLLEDLDILADWIGYLHIHGGVDTFTGPSPYTVVTALVDKIDLHDRKILSDQDLIMKGNVTWVGRSSMEVTMQLHQCKPDNGLRHILDARFLMVARDVANARAAVVSPLVLNTDEERTIFNKGEESSKRRQKMAKTSLFRVAPTATESSMIHDLILQTTAFDFSAQGMRKPENSLWMDDVLMSSVSVCNPQQRNSHNKVFGGFLMRKAFELSWANACVFSRSCPKSVAIDDIWFRKPVEIGSLVEFTSQVVYTPPQPTKRFEVMTVAEVIKPKTGDRVTTNVFYNTFESVDLVPSVLPRTYAEAMRYLDGKRRYEADK